VAAIGTWRFPLAEVGSFFASPDPVIPWKTAETDNLTEFWLELFHV